MQRARRDHARHAAVSSRPLEELPVRRLGADDVAMGRVALLQAEASLLDGPVVNGAIPGAHHGGRCAFLVGVDALDFAYGEGRANLSSADGWLPLIGRRFGRAVINSDEPDHAVERRQWGPLFTTTGLTRALPVADGVVTRAVASWRRDGTVDAYAQARALSFTVMAQALAGIDDAHRAARLGGAFAAVLDGPKAGESPDDCQRRLAPIRSGLEQDLAAGVAALRAAGPDATGLVPLLLRAVPTLDDAALVRHVGVLMVAGHETTGSLLARVLLALCDHPVWQTRLATEATAAMPGGSVALPTLEAVPLADAFVTEVARLHPSLLNAPRIATRSFAFAGIRIAAGHPVALAIGATQRLAASFASPETFDPARFLGNDVRMRSPPILTFATGARYCLGARFAMLEAKLVIARVLAQVRVVRAAPGASCDTGFWNARPRGALDIRLLPRVPDPAAA
ncbi:MAG: cytochrome P450 [Casimicrobiaceae bacterium]